LLSSPLQEGIIQRALTAGKVAVHMHNIRDCALDKHAMTDDRPFGGGEGMVMKPEPIAASLGKIESEAPGGRVILLSPQGRRYDQEMARELAGLSHIVLICGRYEGVDERIHQYWVNEEISIGDYILTGGELAAMILIDSITRLLPGVLGCNESAECDAFSQGMLKHPQYTRPRVFQGHEVPEVLLSGDHRQISEWRFAAAVKNTAKKRPELLLTRGFSPAELLILKKYKVDLPFPVREEKAV
jgi:tRNA (guanine37-N1)-methyltransferase